MTARQHARLIVRRCAMSLVSEAAKATAHLVQVVTSHVDAAACVMRDELDASRPVGVAPAVVAHVPASADRRAN